MSAPPIPTTPLDLDHLQAVLDEWKTADSKVSADDIDKESDFVGMDQLRLCFADITDAASHAQLLTIMLSQGPWPTKYRFVYDGYTMKVSFMYIAFVTAIESGHVKVVADLMHRRGPHPPQLWSDVVAASLFQAPSASSQALQHELRAEGLQKGDIIDLINLSYLFLGTQDTLKISQRGLATQDTAIKDELVFLWQNMLRTPSTWQNEPPQDVRAWFEHVLPETATNITLCADVVQNLAGRTTLATMPWRSPMLSSMLSTLETDQVIAIVRLLVSNPLNSASQKDKECEQILKHLDPDRASALALHDILSNHQSPTAHALREQAALRAQIDVSSVKTKSRLL